MGHESAIGAAAKRLSAALETLESVVERRRELARDAGALTQQIEVTAADRSRLAAALDEATAKSRRLEAANRDVSRRLDGTIEAVRALRDEQDR